MTSIFTNHIGYDSDDTKNAVYRLQHDEKPVRFRVIDETTGEVAFEGVPTESGEVDNWKTGYYYTLRFDEVTKKGKYYIEVLCDDGGEVRSYPFKIDTNLLETDTLSAAGYFFQSMRCTGEYEYADRKLKPQYHLLEGEHDLHGGWHDATGDPGVHLSHLNDTTFFNPQQAAFTAYAFFKMHELIEQADYPYYTQFKRRLLEEGIYGADFLMRMRAPSGGFFITICHANALEPVSEIRTVGAHMHRVKKRHTGWASVDLDDLRIEDYEVSLRSGGGYAVAALAAAARQSYPGQYSKEEYLTTARTAIKYLTENNEKYTNDGKWNIVDYYCALDAYVELYKTTREYGYLVRARDMAEKLMSLYIAVDENMGYMSADETGRPFFHAADAGMPVVNLINYYEIESDKCKKAAVLELCEKVMKYQISITKEVANPFGYARQYIQNIEGKRKVRFFFPHDCETAGWWQGESARLGSLATAARAVFEYSEKQEMKAELKKFADDQINWILGLNPYDSCMFQGRGRNGITYFYIGNRYDFFQVPGGIVNGITGGIDDEHGIEFIFEPTEDIHDNWRWAEQWLPHNTWYMYALCYKKR